MSAVPRARNNGPNLWLMVPAVLALGAAGAVAIDLWRGADRLSSLHQTGLPGFSSFSEIHHHIQESRKGITTALVTSDAKLQRGYVERARAADLEVGELLTSLVDEAAPASIRQSAANFSRSWRLYLGIRDQVASLLQANRKDPAIQMDHRQAAPAFDRAYQALREIKAALDHHCATQVSALESILVRVGIELAVLLAGLAVFFWLRSREKHRVLVQMQQAVAELDSAKSTAETASRLKSQFLATISHEIRTPLNGVIGMTTLLSESSLDSDQREQLETIDHSARILLTLINDVLDLSKIESGKLELEKQRFELRQAIERVLPVVKPQARQKGLKLACDISPQLPRFVMGDSVRLTQVLLNLTANAVKFTARGHVRIRVSPSKAGQELIRFEVEDTGIGVPQEALARLFEPFTQADGSFSRRYGGAGVGLSIAKRLVDLMGGEIGAAERVRGGTIFWFTAALPSVEHAEPETAPATLPAAPATPRGRVLVVDDNRVNLTVAVKLVERLGYQAVGVSDGPQAVQTSTENAFSAILMDCQMPEMDGFEATRRIRYNETGKRHTPIIALTANAMKGDRERCLQAGMDDYMAKPLDLLQLSKTLDHWATKGSTGVQSPPTPLHIGTEPRVP